MYSVCVRTSPPISFLHLTNILYLDSYYKRARSSSSIDSIKPRRQNYAQGLDKTRFDELWFTMDTPGHYTHPQAWQTIRGPIHTKTPGHHRYTEAPATQCQHTSSDTTDCQEQQKNPGSLRLPQFTIDTMGHHRYQEAQHTFWDNMYTVGNYK